VHHKIPMIAYTASMNPTVLNAVKLAGMHECVLKTDRMELINIVSRCLHEKKALIA